MEKGTVYFFTGLAGAGKTTIGGLFYQKLHEISPNAVLKDGDKLRAMSGHRDYSTESRKKGAVRGLQGLGGPREGRCGLQYLHV